MGCTIWDSDINMMYDCHSVHMSDTLVKQYKNLQTGSKHSDNSVQNCMQEF